jgi:hypothetical protein
VKANHLDKDNQKCQHLMMLINLLSKENMMFNCSLIVVGCLWHCLAAGEVQLRNSAGIFYQPDAIGVMATGVKCRYGQ